MKVEIYKVTEDCWRLVADDGAICVLDDLPAFFEPLDFKKSDGTITKWAILYFSGANKSDPYDYFGELYEPIPPGYFDKSSTPTFSMTGPAGHTKTMKRFLLRTVAYIGLYGEIFSAFCRWFSRPDRKPWRTVVTKSLVAAGYLPPTCEERNAARAQEQINSEHEALIWIAKQPETIQACLKSFDPSLLKKFYRRKKPVEIYPFGEL